ncbi:SMI1/KNR4 family protein [Streptomyces sp. KL118A]|uniref:SMI1/KNR4 family protein n=1 Tax=Streptomyces sp. KL118A TaxID=3045153 RepID=UPI00278C25FE|nr:SMI1/KNR4 family protein [Streptomyces sp. KL118A]
MGEVWAGVRERVLALREAPNRRAVFGAYFKEYGHRFELRPVLTEEQVDAVERRRGGTFPAEYRSFLMEVGAGGAGPDYGVFTVEPPETETETEFEPDSGVTSEPGRALPFRPERTAEWEEHQAAEPQRSAYGDSDEDGERFREAYAAWDKRDDELLESLTEGALYVSEQGCGYYTLLALTGPERGTMWQDVRAAAEGVIPFAFPGSTDRVTFAEWYVHWLTRAERQAWQVPEDRTDSS